MDNAKYVEENRRAIEAFVLNGFALWLVSWEERPIESSVARPPTDFDCFIYGVSQGLLLAAANSDNRRNALMDWLAHIDIARINKEILKEKSKIKFDEDNAKCI